MIKLNNGNLIGSYSTKNLNKGFGNIEFDARELELKKIRMQKK
jgi:hypothetical protein